MSQSAKQPGKSNGPDPRQKDEEKSRPRVSEGTGTPLSKPQPPSSGRSGAKKG